MFHAHRFQRVLAGNLYFTLIAPGHYTFPYPPGFYLFACGILRASLAARRRRHEHSLRIVALHHGRRGRWLRRSVSPFAGIWNAPWTVVLLAVALLVPDAASLQFRIFTVGNSTNAFAESPAICLCARHPRRRGASTEIRGAILSRLLTLSCSLMAFLISHTSTFSAPVRGSAFSRWPLWSAWKGDDALSAGVYGPRTPSRHFSQLAPGRSGLYYAHFGDRYLPCGVLRIRTETASAAPDAGGRDLACARTNRARVPPLYLGLAVLVLAAYRRLGSVPSRRTGSTDARHRGLGALMHRVSRDRDRYPRGHALLPGVDTGSRHCRRSRRRRPLASGTTPRVAAIALLIVVCWSGVATRYTTF